MAEVDDRAHPLRAAALQADLGKLLRGTGDEAGSDAAYASAMELLPDDAKKERAYLLEQHAMSMMLRGRYEQADQLATEAAELARKHGDVDVLSRARRSRSA